MSLLSYAVPLAMLVALGLVVTAFLAWCAAATVGAASVLVHNRTRPTTLNEWALWACRGVAYVTAAALSGAFGVYAAFGRARLSAFVAVIIALALVAVHMHKGYDYRHREGSNGS